MSTTTTTPTEISSNSNSSCRLLVCLNTLPFHDQRVFRSLLGHIDFLRLSACCHSLRSSIRNDTVLWQQLYHRDFLSGVNYSKEMDFVLWCVRTDVNNPCTSDKRADLLESVDWYNTYRRRVSTENNWRYGRRKITRIDMEHDKEGLCYSTEAEANSLVIIQQTCLDRAPSHYYTLEYLPHSNLKSSNNIVYDSTFSTSPNIISLDGGNAIHYIYVTGDHYRAVSPRRIESGTDYNVKILSRKHGGVFTTFNIPVQYRVDTIEGKWALLVDKSQEVINAMVLDIDNSIMCPGSIDCTLHAICFHKTVNDTAIVYTVRLAVDDETECIEWALYQFSSNNPVVQLRNGWFELPEGMMTEWILAYKSYNSYMIIELGGHPDYHPCILHSVTSSGQNHTPRNCYTMTDQHIPTPLLRAGCNYSGLNSRSTKVWADLSYNDDQVLRMPRTSSIKHIIGDLYVFITRDHDRVCNQFLVDINTMEIIRQMEESNTSYPLDRYAMVGSMCSYFDNCMPIIEEYGEL